MEKILDSSDGMDLTGGAYRAFWALELAHTLWQQIDTGITLDEIDGAFYWYICRWQEFDKLMEDVRNEGDGPDPEADARFAKFAMELPTASDAVYDTTHPQLRSALHLYWPSENTVLLPWFGQPTRQRMPGILCLGVTSSEWRGADVARAAEHEIGRTKARFPGIMEFDAVRARRESTMMLDFRFAEEDTLDLSHVYQAEVSEALKDEPFVFRAPSIVCRFSYPLPPPEIIAHAYDHEVINRHEWHKELNGYGARHNQTPEVAIRSWAIGIFVGAGLPFFNATKRFYDNLELEGFLSQPQWNSDRANLVARVPEAREYVYARRREHKTDEAKPS